MFFIKISSLVLCFFYAQAKTTLTLGDIKKTDSFLSYIENTPGVESLLYSDLQKMSHRSSRLISSKFQLAIDNLVSPEINSSVHLFKEIIDFQKTHIFPATDRSYISNSYFYLARLEKSKYKKWLKAAALYDPYFQPSSKTFNPMLREKFNKFTAQAKKNIITLPPLNTSKKVYIDGSPLRKTYSKKDNYYVTIYQNGFEKKSLILSPFDLSQLHNIQLKPLHLGTCARPLFQKKHRHIFYSSTCIQQQFTLASSHSTPQPQLLQTENNLLKTKTSRPKKLSKKNLWLALGVSFLATSAAIMINKQNQNQKFKPVHTLSSQ